MLSFLRSPISHLLASSFPKGPSEKLRRWRQAGSQAGLVGGCSYTTMRAKTHYLLYIVMVCNCHTHFRTWQTWNCLLWACTHNLLNLVCGRFSNIQPSWQGSNITLPLIDCDSCCVISVIALRSKCQALLSKLWICVAFGLICVDSM